MQVNDSLGKREAESCALVLSVKRQVQPVERPHDAR